MKFFKIVILCASMLTLITSMAFSETSAQTAAGSPVTLTDSSSTTPAPFDFTPSPSTSMEIQTSATSYALSAVSTKTNADNGYHYGAVAAASAIFQLKVVAGDVSSTTGLVTLQTPASAISLGSTWEDKAGNSAP